MARILITGASGMLGSTIARRWAGGGHELFATGSKEARSSPPIPYQPADLRAPCVALMAWSRPDVVVHCAALTNVDACERDPDGAIDVNGRAVARLAAAAPEARIVVISSDA